MNKALLVLLGSLVAVTSQAAIRVDMKVEAGDGTTAQRIAVVKEGKWTNLAQNHILLKLKAMPDKKTASVRAVIYELKKTGRLYLGDTTVVTPWGQSSEVLTKDEKGKLHYSFKVTPTQVD